MPIYKVESQSVFDSVKDKPRKNLGSGVYTTKIEPVSMEPLSDPSHCGYVSTPQPIPRFDGQENSTYTVRVPRYFLGQPQREEMVQRQFVWGTDVYSDDSDPVAAALHSGWLRGAWDDAVDAAVLELPEPSAADANRWTRDARVHGEVVLAERPAAPMHPLQGLDLEIELLILPRLAAYHGSVRYGVRSRDFPSRHDGLSFAVHRLRWVDQHRLDERRSGKGKGELRRARIRRLMVEADTARKAGVRNVEFEFDGDREPEEGAPGPAKAA